MLGTKQWLQKIGNEAGNPLQEMRKLVQQQGLDKEKALAVLQIKLWAPPLDQAKFTEVIRRLDATLSNDFCTKLFTVLRTPEGKVEVQTMIKNLFGSEEETVDFKVDMFKQLYVEVYQKNQEKRLLALFEKHDKLNEGRIEPADLKKVLVELGAGSSYFSQDAVSKFVDQLPGDPISLKVDYLKFINRIINLGNKNHNPFHLVLQKLEFFARTHSLDAATLLRRIGAATSDGVTTQRFAEFLKEKIHKDGSVDDLAAISQLMDIDKDGFVCAEDLGTCLKNANSEQFVKQSGKAMQKPQFNSKDKFFTADHSDLNEEKIVEVCARIRQAIKAKGYSTKIMFDAFDTDRDGMLTITEFTEGFNSLMQISTQMLYRLFGYMDSL